MLLLILIANIILSHVIAKQGEDRKIGYLTSFLISFFFTPLMGVLIVIASKELTNEEIEKIKLKESQKYIIEKRDDIEEPFTFNHPITITSILVSLIIVIILFLSSK